MSDQEKVALIVFELIGSFSVIYAITAFITWSFDLSTLDVADRFLMVWLAIGAFAMLQIRKF